MDTFEHKGRRFQVEIEHDSYHGAPWDEEDGHGPVSDWTTRSKRPGERLLHADGPFCRYYDIQEATRIARRDAWDAAPYGGTRGERTARAVEADFDRLRRWCNDLWSYIGVIVQQIDNKGEPIGAPQSIWGVESDCREYIDEWKLELAEQCLAEGFSVVP